MGLCSRGEWATMTRKMPVPYESDFEEWVDDLRGRLFRAYGQRGVNWGHVAHSARLSPATVSNFAQGITRKPHAYTLFRLAVALGWNYYGGWPEEGVPTKKVRKKRK